VPLQSILAHPTPALLAAVIATMGAESGLAVPAAAPAGDTGSAVDAASFQTIGGAARGTASGQASSAVGPGSGALRPASGAARRVVALQPEGPRQPFFCVHPAGGNTFVYKELAELLGTEQPFHAIQSDGLDDELLEDLTIAGMAASYVAAIRAVRPHGPVHLGGWSMGGLVAFEMAQQLRAAGGEAGLLVLFDTRAFTRPDDVDELPEDDVDILHALLGADLSLSLAQLQALPAHRVLSHVVEEGRRRGHLAADFGIEQAKRLLTVYKRNRRLMWDYLPRPYPGAMTLIQARERRPGENPPIGLGWDPLIAGGLATHLVPGNHNNLMIPPYVGAVAELLRTLLAAIDRGAAILPAAGSAGGR
jgi:thioesterase domain-containing protein